MAIKPQNAQQKCRTCLGKGFVFVETKSGDGRRQRSCPACRGSGKGRLSTK